MNCLKQKNICQAIHSCKLFTQRAHKPVNPLPVHEPCAGRQTHTCSSTLHARPMNWLWKQCCSLRRVERCIASDPPRDKRLFYFEDSLFRGCMVATEHGAAHVKIDHPFNAKHGNQAGLADARGWHTRMQGATKPTNPDEPLTYTDDAASVQTRACVMPNQWRLS